MLAKCPLSAVMVLSVPAGAVSGRVPALFGTPGSIAMFVNVWNMILALGLILLTCC